MTTETTKWTGKYVPCKTSEVPEGMRFDTPRRNQGQIVEISYGTFGRPEADHGDPFMCRTDTSLPPDDPERTEYYRWVHQAGA